MKLGFYLYDTWSNSAGTCYTAKVNAEVFEFWIKKELVNILYSKYALGEATRMYASAQYCIKHHLPVAYHLTRIMDDADGSLDWKLGVIDLLIQVGLDSKYRDCIVRELQ